MQLKSFHTPKIVRKNLVLRVVVITFSILLISNLSSIVDSFLHPEIPYFDKKHLIVGGITSLMSSILFCMTLLYAWYLEQALTQIKVLKAFLPICSNCKKIQVIDSKTDTLESW